MAATSAPPVTSARNARASPPSPLMMAAVSSAAARFTSAQNTLAPSRAKVTAVALPLPQPGPIEPAPATSATLFLRRCGMDLHLSAREASRFPSPHSRSEWRGGVRGGRRLRSGIPCEQTKKYPPPGSLHSPPPPPPPPPARGGGSGKGGGA